MKIVLYEEGTAGELDTGEIAGYLGQKLGKYDVEVRGNPFRHLSPEAAANLADKIARTKIQQLHQPMVSGPVPLHAEIEYEKRRILGRSKTFGVIYDGFRLVKIFSETISRQESVNGFVHIILTNRLFATWDDLNRRYHLRTSVYAIPSVISTSGLIEAPARPREYYLLKQQYERLGRDLMELNDKFRGRFLDYGDERLTGVVKGYCMQAVFYHLTGDPFCLDPGCRLYNAHWQKELIYAQLKSGDEFCPGHMEFLKRFAADGDRAVYRENDT